jgi:hypothetical protein
MVPVGRGTHSIDDESFGWACAARRSPYLPSDLDIEAAALQPDREGGRKMTRFLTVLAGVALAAAAVVGLAGATHGSDVLVSVGSPATTFAQNKQNEAAIAVDANHPNVLAAGANEEIDIEACAAGDPTTCPFTNGVGTTGIYFSFDSGDTWIQPRYTGYSARGCLGPQECVPQVGGPIGTLPNYFESGLVSDGDPSLAFGPRPGPNGFSWANGSRLYFANLTSRFPTSTPAETFKGFEAIGVSRTDNVEAAAAGDASAWMRPVIASKQNSTLFSDHEQVWADNAATSPYFGYVYVCYAAFRGQEKGNALPNPITVSRSSDGGDTWKATQVTSATNNPAHGQQDCWVRTGSDGVVYVFWDASKGNTGRAIYMVRSSNGGQTFDKEQVVSSFTPTGQTDPVTGDNTFDGLAGARDGTFPTADIANGAPTGADATDEIVVAWQEGPTPTDRNPGANETLRVAYSTSGGDSWSVVPNAADPGDRPDMPAIAISPDGTDVYVTYNGFLDPWQSTTANPRRMHSVVRHADIGSAGTPGTWGTLFTGDVGDARGSSANGLTGEFLGDYNNAAATRTYGAAIYVDVRDAADCPAIDAYRQSLSTATPIAAPAPNADCPATFGNSDIFGGTFADPTP